MAVVVCFLPHTFPSSLKPSVIARPRRTVIARMVSTTTNSSTPSFIDANLRLSLILSLLSQAAVEAHRTVQNSSSEIIKYANPRRGGARNLGEALMTVPDLETIRYRVLRRYEDYEIREVESYVVAETVMPGKRGFDLYGSSQGFNTLAAYLFGKNKKREEMEMTTPVVVSRSQADGEKMEMTTPVTSQQTASQWQMSFVMPSKYGDVLPIPVDDAVKIRRIPARIMAVTVFSGFVTDEIARKQECKLRDALKRNNEFQLKDSAEVEVAQFNPPFTPPFMRRNEVALEVQLVEGRQI
eukprot:c25815_g1_i1 orf=211-1101(+)